jgi:hypothetical protein
MERTTFLKNYRIRLQYDGTRTNRIAPVPTSYEAVDERTGEPVSVTLIPAASFDSSGREVFEEQISSARKLHHANIAKVHDFGAKATITFMCRSGFRVRHWRHGCAATEQCLPMLPYESVNRL